MPVAPPDEARFWQSLQNGLNIDEIVIDNDKVSVLSGTMKSDEKQNVTVECSWERPEGKHSLKAFFAKNDDSDSLQIDKSVIANAKIEFERELESPSLGGVLGGLLGGSVKLRVTQEGELNIKFIDITGAEREIRISTVPV